MCIRDSVRVAVEVVERDQGVAGHVQVAQLGSDRHVADHRAADVTHLAAGGVGEVEHLLHPVHVRAEAGHDDLRGRLREDPFHGRGHVDLGGRETRRLGVRRVDQHEVDALLAGPREAAQVGEALVERQLVHLEVARVQHGCLLYTSRCV